MPYYINEWSDQTASLNAIDGYSLNTFENLADAIDAYFYDYMVEPEYIEILDNYPGVPDLDFESGFV
jgi:hypothetical protein